MARRALVLIPWLGLAFAIEARNEEPVDGQPHYQASQDSDAQQNEYGGECFVVQGAAENDDRHDPEDEKPGLGNGGANVAEIETVSAEPAEEKPQQVGDSE